MIQEVRVWSAVPNGVDENGAGDDIPFSRR